MLNVGRVIDTMRAGLLRMGQWVLGAGLAALVAFAHAQPAFAPHGGGFHSGGGGFERAPMMHEAPHAAMPAQWGGDRGAMRRGEGYGGVPGGHYGAAPMRVADQGGWHERGGGGGGGRQPERRAGGNGGGNGASPYGNPYGNGFGGYHSPIQTVSAESRQVPHPPADSPVRAGSIREDVARYNEERSSYRPGQRGGGDVPRPPMPAPYRN
jgi:hypothetical protein